MKNFTNNFKQFTSRLSARWLIMALMLLLGTSSAWAATVNGVIYFEKPNANWGTPVLCLGKNDGSQMNFTMELHCGNIYKKQVTWGDGNATCIAFTDCTGNWGWEGNSLEHRLNYISGNGTYQYDISSNPAGKIFKPGTTNNPVNNGNGNLYSWDGGYAEKTFSESLCCTAPAAPFGGTAQSETICAGSYTFSSDYKWYTTTSGTTTVSGTTTINENKTYYIASVATEGCESSRTKYTINVNPIPSFSKNPTNKSICEGDSEDNLTTLSGVTVSNGSPVWYNAQTGGSKVNVADVVNGGTYWVAAENATTGCKNATRKQFVLTVNPRPNAPTFDAIAAQCGSYTLPAKDKNKVNVNWYTAATDGEKITSVNTTGIYHAEAVDGTCTSAERTLVQITINTKPSISSITQNVQSPVPFEDVVLTADGVTSGAEVNWYVEENLVAENTNTYTVTSETAGDVIVKAKAFLGDCESEAATKTVTFDEEDCNSTTTQTEDEKTIEIWCRMSDNSNGSSIKCYGFGAGDFFGSYPGSNANNGTGTYNSKTYQKWKYTFDSKKSGLNVIFNTDGDNDKTGDISVGSSGKRYYYWYNKSSKTYGLDASETIYTTTITPAPIIAPAVKMISAEYDEENDVIVATGAVYKTGCGVTFWGFQYSEDGQTWGTEDTDFIRPDNNNSLTVPGEFHYSFPISNANGGETYYIRAYALNNYNGSYALSNAVYSATSLPVEIPSKTIESATISLVDSEGDALDVTEVCPQSTVYLKVSYVGGDFKDYEAADNFPGTNLELVNHDKAHNYAIFSYTATATGVANITISNDNTSITTTNGVSITLKNVTPVNAPMISISQGTICEGGSATITVDNPIENLTYTLYKETEPIGSPVNYQTGDLTFDNVIEAGSYTVRAEESICHNYANSMPVELKVVTSDVKIGLAVDKTTVNPWQPLKLTVTPPEGYAYSIDGLAGVVYTQSGDVYTIKIPRPNAWSPGNSGDSVETMPITFSAKIQVTDDLTCGTSSVNVTLADTEENCK